jgi:hypothetical protein
MFAATIRGLAVEAQAVLTPPATGEAARDPEAVGALLRRIDALLDRVGEGRRVGLRLWLETLRRQALVVQGMVDLRRRVEDLEARQDDPAAT